MTPLVIEEAVVREAEERCRRFGALVAVLPFRRLAVGAVAPATLEARARDRFEKALVEKLAWFGALLAHLEFAEPEAAAMAHGVEAGLEKGAKILLAAGANVLDPLDPTFGAMQRLGARIVRRGAPADPGSLLWLARLGDVPVVGVTSCGMFSRATLFDLVLPRLLAGESVGPAEIAAFGHGGLLNRDMAFRFPPYRPGLDRGSVA